MKIDAAAAIVLVCIGIIIGFAACLWLRPPVLTHHLVLDQPVATECAFDLEIDTLICPGRVPGEGG